jgi:hypothetical protein
VEHGNFGQSQANYFLTGLGNKCSTLLLLSRLYIVGRFTRQMRGGCRKINYLQTRGYPICIVYPILLLRIFRGQIDELVRVVGNGSSSCVSTCGNARLRVFILVKHRLRKSCILSVWLFLAVFVWNGLGRAIDDLDSLFGKAMIDLHG